MKTAIAFGAFDGLHAGHRAVLDKTRGFFRTAVTFSGLPKFDVKGNGLLMSVEDREKALYRFGMDKVVFLDFAAIKDMSPLEFLQYIKDIYDVALIACGENFRFGRKAAGNTDILADFCRKNGIALSVVKPVKTGDTVISSSMIRHYISAGEIEKANAFLYLPYRIKNIVKKGDMRGRVLGFPTINQDIPAGLITPKCGVYAACVKIDGKEYNAVCNIGIRPTYKTERIAAETHIIGFSGDLYGRRVAVYPYRFLRAEKKFSCEEELVNAVKKDITEVKK